MPQIDEIELEVIQGHAPLPPSGFYRRYNCPGSIIDEASAKKVQNSLFAEDGDESHDIAKLLLYSYFQKIQYHAKFRSAVQKKAVLGYTQFCIDKFNELPCAISYIEQRVVFTKELFGTADFLFHNDKKLVLIDYKYGIGVKVNAVENFQLICYMLAARKTLGIDPETITCHIYQPRSYQNDYQQYVSTWELTKTELDQWELIINDASNHCIEIKEGKKEPVYKVGKWCQFCSAKYKCKTFKLTSETNQETGEHLIELEKPMPKLNELPEDVVLALYKNIPNIKALLSAVEKVVVQKAVDDQLPEHKAVKFREVKEWVSEDDAAIELIKRGISPFKKNLISVAEAKKALGQNASDIEGLIRKRGGSYKVVPLAEEEKIDDLTSVEVEES